MSISISSTQIRVIAALLLTIGFETGAKVLAEDLRPQFDVASVRADNSQTGVDRVRNSEGSLVVINVSLRRCIAMAYEIPDSREYLIAGPDWIDLEHFDIQAKYPPETSHANFLLMFQRLLDERFHMQLRHQFRDTTVYALVVGKNGPKLRIATKPTEEHSFPCGAPPGGFSVRQGHALGCSISMPDLADRLSRPVFGLNRPVVDMTGLSNRYDLTLDFADETRPDDPRPSLLTAIEEELGLKLEVRKIQLDTVVIDHADKAPIPN